MVKNIFLAAVATLILAAATVPVGSTAAMACHGCYKAAKAAHLSTMKRASCIPQGVPRSLHGRQEGLVWRHIGFERHSRGHADPLSLWDPRLLAPA